MAQEYNPSLVTKNLVFCGDAASSLATPALDLDVLIVAGGGGGGYALGGGGGGGGVVHLTNANVSKGTYAIVVGAGGISDENGSNSTIFGATAAGGGGGDGYQDASGNSGGCGGGAGAAQSGGGVGGAATGSSLGTRTGTIYGNKGGNQTAARVGSPTSARAGGGAGAAGADEAPSTTDGGTGGAGIQINIDGNNYYWAGGGGGAAYNGAYAGGAGGLGGGGGGSSNGIGVGAGGTGGLNNGATPTITSIGGVAGTNTGSGGGGGAWSTYAGGAGGSGIVIIRLAAKNNLGVATAITTLSGKSYTTYTSGGVSYYVWTYTASGNFTIPHSLLVDRAGGNSGMMYNGTVVQLDGGDEYLDCGVIDYSSYTGLSVCAWINGPGLSAAQTFVSNWGPSGTSDYAWLLFISQWASSQPEWLVSTNGTGYSRLAATSTLASNQWHHLVGTWESGSMKLYLNGVLDASGSGPASIYNPAYKTAVGADFDGGTPRRPFDGMMADVRVYDKVLSLANVKEIYDDSKVIIPTKNDGSGGFIGQSNLKIWLPLMEGAGTIGYDGSGNGNNGIGTNFDAGSGANADWLTGQTGCPQLVGGYNRPITFNLDRTSTDYVDTGDVYAADEMTLVAWVNMSVVPSAAASAYPMLFGKRGTDTQRSYFLAFDAANKLYWEIKDAAAVYYVQKSTKTDWNANQWYHIAVNYVASTGIAKMYIDGVEDAGTFSPAQPWSLDPIPDTSATCRIGGGYYWFEGIINEAAFYNKALGATDIAALAATDPNGGPLPPDPMTMSYSTSSTSSSNIIGYWRNDNSVSWTDLSGNGKTGTVSGAPPSLLFKQGVNGQKNVNTGRDNQGFPLLYKDVGAVGFNGSDNYIQIPQFDFTSTHTFSWWFNPLNLTEKYSGGYAGHMLCWGYSPTIRMYLLTTGKIQIYASATSGATFSPTNFSVSVGEWAHITYAANYDSGEALLYKNGVLTDTVDISSLGAWSYTGASNVYDYIDFGKNVSNNNIFYAGSLGGLQIYNRALTYAEIQQNYKSFKTRFGK